MLYLAPCSLTAAAVFFFLIHQHPTQKHQIIQREEVVGQFISHSLSYSQAAATHQVNHTFGARM